MLDKSKITEFPVELRKYCVSDLSVRSEDQAIILYIPKAKLSETVKPGFISRNQIDNLTKKLSMKYDTKCEVIYLKSDKLEFLSKGFETLLSAKFPILSDSIFFSFLSAQKVNVWIAQENLDAEVKERFSNYLQKLLNDAGIEMVSLKWPEEGRKPSPVQLLSTTKVIQPSNLDGFVNKLKSDFNGVTREWVNRELDKLIKKGFIIRDSNTETYALSGAGINIIPNTRTRSNSDIIRALDLGRRKW